MSKIRILHCLNGINNGGAETFIMNLYRHINTNEIQFDFMVREKTENDYTKEIEQRGGKIYVMPNFPKHFLKNMMEVRRFFKNNNKYKAIHVHANSLLYIYPLIAAKRVHINKRIIHSHNTMSASIFYIPIHKLNKCLLKVLSTDMWACSEKAGNWMFGRRKFTVINNSIDAAKYRFDDAIRKKVRKVERFGDKIVIGNIGRFEIQKNHKFLINVFKEYHNKNCNSILVLVGDGRLKKEIENETEKLGLSEDIMFMGIRNDIPDLLKAMDYFVMPSLFEGLPFALIEAQAAGTKCFIADNITDEAIITSNVTKLPIDKGTKCWVDALIDTSIWKRDTYVDVCNNGFDVESVANAISKEYLK